MYLPHFTLSTVLQNIVMPSTSSCLHFGLTSLRMNSFNSCPKFSIGLQSGDSGHQFMLLSNLLSSMYALDHYPAWTSETLLRNGRSAVKDAHIKCCIHYAIKDSNSRWTTDTDCSPNMYFNLMFRSGKKKKFLIKVLALTKSRFRRLPQFSPLRTLKGLMFERACRCNYDFSCVLFFNLLE